MTVTEAKKKRAKKKKRKASTLITATTNVYFSKPISTDLTKKTVLVLTNPVGKDVVRGWSM